MFGLFKKKSPCPLLDGQAERMARLAEKQRAMSEEMKASGQSLLSGKAYHPVDSHVLRNVGLIS